jgi:hypothetical protein
MDSWRLWRSVASDRMCLVYLEELGGISIPMPKKLPCSVAFQWFLLPYQDWKNMVYQSHLGSASSINHLIIFFLLTSVCIRVEEVWKYENSIATKNFQSFHWSSLFSYIVHFFCYRKTSWLSLHPHLLYYYFWHKYSREKLPTVSFFIYKRVEMYMRVGIKTPHLLYHWGHLGALAGDPGCFPLDDEAYPPSSIFYLYYVPYISFIKRN